MLDASDTLILPDLPAELVRLLAQVPAGRVTTYGTLADCLGNRMASRWVGQWMMRHPHDRGCACHRVVRADGTLGVYGPGPTRVKQALLIDEGVDVRGGKVSLADHQFSGFTTASPRPLVALNQRQQDCQTRLSESPPRRLRQHTSACRMAGIDVSYTPDQQAVACYVLLDETHQQPLWSVTITQAIEFPYITGYLAFRELPVMLAAIENARRAGRLADVVWVDGSGVLHPRRCGIAAMLGVLGRVPTVGLTKKVLVGEFDTQQLHARGRALVAFEDAPLGAAVLAPTGSDRPLVISPGDRMDVATALLLYDNCRGARRLPAPIHWADRLSRAAARGSTKDGFN